MYNTLNFSYYVHLRLTRIPFIFLFCITYHTRALPHPNLKHNCNNSSDLIFSLSSSSSMPSLPTAYHCFHLYFTSLPTNVHTIHNLSPILLNPILIYTYASSFFRPVEHAWCVYNCNNINMLERVLRFIAVRARFLLWWREWWVGKVSVILIL